VLRTIGNSLLSLLMMATFMWGGCVSCEQYFMFPGKQQQQSCCNKSGQCERPGKTSPKPEKQDCNRLPLGRSEIAHPVPVPVVLSAIVAVVAQPLSFPVRFRVAALEVLLDPSPPDLQALNATFLI
jgi:hypothetical protein